MTTNNLSNQNVVVKLLKLPMVHSACSILSVLYVDTKGRHPQVCEVVENGMKAITSMVSPVIIRLEPQISMANDLACIGLDWIENTFPVVHKPTEQITASAKNMMHEAKDLMSIAGNGTVDCVQYGICWAVGKIQAQVTDPERKVAVKRQSPVKRAIIAATQELDSALSLSEALVDRALPPTSADMEEDEEDKAVEGFDLTTVRSSVSVRLFSLTTKLCRRTYHMVGAKMHTVKDNWLGVLVEWKDHVHFKQLEEMYNLISPLSDQILPVGVQVSLDAAFAYLIRNITINGLVEPINGLVEPVSTSLPLKSTSQPMIKMKKKAPVTIPVFINGCKAKI